MFLFLLALEEAGSYGKDTKGILRVHQFDKIEMFTFCKPERFFKRTSTLAFNGRRDNERFKNSYRVLNICTGDLGDPAVSKYDIEAWLPGQNNGAGNIEKLILLLIVVIFSQGV